jgi:diaminopimelate decarboxylase
MTREKLSQLLPQLGTPAYIFDLDAFARRAEMVRRYFGDTIGLCFSIKANPFLLKYLPAVFDRIEVCSPGELTVCEKLKADMAKVIFSGVNKGYADVERAADDRVGVFTAESRLHLNLINDAALRRGEVFDLLLRVTDSKGGSQFGMDEADVLDIIARRADYPGVNIVGLHYFTGTGKKKAKIIERELDYLADLIDRIRDTFGFVVERVEYGTGLAVDYFDADADTIEEQRLAEVSPKLRELAEKCALTVEMGRFFAAPCGTYLTRVVDTKTNAGVNYAIVDGGLHQLKYDGQLQGMQIPVIRHLSDRPADGDPEPWNICGSLCTTADVLVRSCPFTDLRIGDVLAFTRTGAYSCMEGMSIFLSRDLPAIALYSETRGLELVRRPFLTDVFNTPQLITDH